MPPLVHWSSPSARGLEQQIEELHTELAPLPEPPSGPKGGSLGFHSWQHSNLTRPSGITVDLGEPRPIDAIVMVPANVVYGIGPGGGYGFPPRFRVEVAEDEDFNDANVVADHTATPIENPSGSPVVLQASHISARFVRITATELWTWPGNRRAHFALGELLIFSGGRNIAPWRTVTADDSLENKPLWSARNLVDGQSSLGHAIAAGHSSTNGYHSQIETNPEVVKWIQLDFGETVPIEEIRLYPARPVDYAESHGFGFPEKFRVECADDSEFHNPKLLFDASAEPFYNPGDNPVPIPVDHVSARFVRVTATQLWRRHDDYIFALAEVQAFSRGQNIAPDATTTASDSLEAGFWSLEYLTDGSDSQNALTTDEFAWLKGLARRHTLEKQLAQTGHELDLLVGKVSARLARAAIAVTICLAGLAAFAIGRSRLLRQREIERVRERIASDLHDEIGSNLGSIALLSALGDADDLAEINRIALETGESMRDIVWVIRGGHDSLNDLLLRMREVATTMLKQLGYTFVVSPEQLPAHRIPLEFKRNVLLFFKEAIHNLARHSGASHATIKIEIVGDWFLLRVGDNGHGFNPDAAAAQSGSGLKNLANRASSLHGTTTIESRPGGGTNITLQAPYR